MFDFNTQMIKSLNYFKFFTEEEPNQGYYRDLYLVGEEKFNDWFCRNYSEFTVNTMAEISKTSDEIFQKLRKSKYEATQNQCHNNSQKACLLDAELDLFTGFIIRCDEEIITHSFCLYKGNVVDFTAVNCWHCDDSGFNVNKFPIRYIGVKISNDFLNSVIKKRFIKNENLSIPYLYEWFIHTIGLQSNPLIIPNLKTNRN